MSNKCLLSSFHPPPRLHQRTNIYNSLGIVSSYSTQEKFFNEYGVYPTGAPFPLDAAEESALASVDLALTLAYVCFALDFLGMIGGFTLFFAKINLLQIVAHAVGGIYTSWFIAYGWQYQSLWYIVGFTSFPTAVVEVMMLIAIFGVKIVVY